MTQNNLLDKAIKASYVGLVVNIFLSIGKFLAGIFGNSMVMIADAVHSASDVFSTLIVISAVKISGKPEDSDHEYGHERFESIGAIVLSVMLAMIGCQIGFNGFESLINGDYENSPLPSMIALIAAIVSIVVKEIMFQYTKKVGEECRSEAMIADAWHHRSDAMSSIGSLIGIGGAQIGFAFMDSLASIAVCIAIIFSALEIFRSAVDKLTDHSCSEEIEDNMNCIIASVEGVKRIDLLKTRLFGASCYVDVEISVDGELSMRAAHEIAEKVHLQIENNFDNVKHCTVHVNPFEK